MGRPVVLRGGGQVAEGRALPFDGSALRTAGRTVLPGGSGLRMTTRLGSSTGAGMGSLAVVAPDDREMRYRAENFRRPLLNSGGEPNLERDLRSGSLGRRRAGGDHLPRLEGDHRLQTGREILEGPGDESMLVPGPVGQRDFHSRGLHGESFSCGRARSVDQADFDLVGIHSSFSMDRRRHCRPPGVITMNARSGNRRPLL